MATSSKVLSIAAGEIGYSRWSDPQTGTKYGRWYRDLTGAAYFGQNGTPYCAMFAAWVLAQAGQSCPGMPTASCGTALSGARKAGIVRANKKDARAGDLVIFDWSGKATATNHIGFVEKNLGSYIQTIEGNTSSGDSGSQDNGGGVYRRTRAWKYVTAVIAVPYSGSGGASSGGTVEVDGVIGNKSISELQRQRGTVVDGVISGQYIGNQKYLPNVVSINWTDTGQSALVKSIQAMLKAKGYSVKVDGYLGKSTVTALQRWMREECGYKKHEIDGILGAKTAANVQNAINAGKFRA